MYYATNAVVYTSCGLGILGNFTFGAPHWDAAGQIKNLSYRNVRGGCGWIVVGFVPTRESKQSYVELTAKFPLMYQSPVRTHRNSGRKFFFAIFDTKEPL